MTGNGSIFKQVGPMRVMWGAVVILCLILVFFTGCDGAGWCVIPAYVAPVVVVLHVWGLLFDLLMSWVFMRQKQAQERLRYRNILIWDGLLVVLLFAFWGPYYASLLAGR